MKRGDKGFIDLRSSLDDPEDLDPSIRATLGAGRKRQEEMSLSPAERKRKTKERKKAAARAGRRATYDLSPEIIQAVQSLAGQNKTTASQVAALLLVLGINAVNSGAINLQDFREPLANPYYEFAIKAPKITGNQGETGK